MPLDLIALAASRNKISVRVIVATPSTSSALVPEVAPVTCNHDAHDPETITIDGILHPKNLAIQRRSNNGARYMQKNIKPSNDICRHNMKCNQQTIQYRVTTK